MASRSSRIRAARVGDLLTTDDLAHGRTRRLEATAFVHPGAEGLAGYIAELERHGDDFAAWDGRVVSLPADGERDHQVTIADRYGQVYETISGADAASLPGPDALEDWFRFLATACPECGVLDDPRERAWVP